MKIMRIALVVALWATCLWCHADKVDWDAVRAEEEANFEWYIENKEWIVEQYPPPLCVLIRSKEIIFASEYFRACMDKLKSKLGDICLCVDDETRTSSDEESLVIVPGRQRNQSINVDPPFDVDLADYVKFKPDRTDQLILTSYDRNPQFKKSPCLNGRLQLYATIEKNENTFHGLNISFLLDTGAKDSYVTEKIYEKLKKLNFHELFYPQRMLGFIGKFPVGFQIATDHFKEYNIFGTDISRFFKFEFSMYLGEFSVTPIHDIFFETGQIPDDCLSVACEDGQSQCVEKKEKDE